MLVVCALVAEVEDAADGGFQRHSLTQLIHHIAAGALYWRPQ